MSKNHWKYGFADFGRIMLKTEITMKNNQKLLIFWSKICIVITLQCGWHSSNALELCNSLKIVLLLHWSCHSPNIALLLHWSYVIHQKNCIVVIHWSCDIHLKLYCCYVRSEIECKELYVSCIDSKVSSSPKITL